MNKSLNEMPTRALFCYCLLAIGITLIACQSRTLSQDKSESKSDSDQSTEPKNDSSEKLEKNSSGESLVVKKIEPLRKESLRKESKSPSPVVQVKTEATEGDTSLTFQSKPFDVVEPDWYSVPVTSEDQKTVIPIRAFGFDDELLKDDFETKLQEKIDLYVDELLGSEANQYVSFTDAEKNNLIKKKEVRPGRYFNGSKQEPLDFIFAHVEFDQSFQSLAKNKWVEQRQQSRLIQYGLIGGATLVLIGFVFGGMRLNSATSGFYQGRLQFFVAIVILGVIAAGVYFGSRIDWL